MLTWDVDVKNQIRSDICKGGPYKRVLLLPSDTCLDVIELLNNNAITAETSITAVERDTYTCDFIKEKLKELGFKDIQVINSELHEVELEGSFDFVYLDTCGNLTANILTWLANQAQAKVFNGRVVLAFSNYIRGSFEFLQKWDKYAKSSKKVNPTKLGSNSEAQNKQHKSIANMLISIFGDLQESWIYKNEGNHATMHVFGFNARSNNSGITNVVKFLLTNTTCKPKLLSPGLKAAATRLNYQELAPKGVKAKANRSKAMQELLARIEALEALLKKPVDKPTKGLIILESIEGTSKSKCQCFCGKLVAMNTKVVKNGARTSCGCNGKGQGRRKAVK